ncbi:MAG: TolC family protein [Prevotellaceae bacterium]|nr:TolC family protein [Prevotellaceae bacterium]
MNIKYLLFMTLCLPANVAFAQDTGNATISGNEASAARKWTLDDCIRHAMANNISLKKSQVSIMSSKEDVEQARAAMLPSLSASTNQSLGWRPWNEAGVSTVANGTVVNKVSKTYYNGSYAVNAQWTLWNGNRNRNTLKQNKVITEKTVLDSATTANTLKEQIANLYVQILYLNEAIAVNKQSYATSLKNEESGKAQVEVGKMSKADLAQLSAQTKQDEYNIVNAQAETAKAKLQLKQLLELEGDEEFDIFIPQESDDKALAIIPSLQDVYQNALACRPEIASSIKNIESQELQVKIAKAGTMPQISMNGGLGTSTSSMNSHDFGYQLKTNFDATAGLSLSIPIFDNRSTKTNVNKARLAVVEANLDLQDKRKTLYSTIEGYWLDANTNQQKFKAAQASVESMKASYELLSEQFRLGLKNIVELMTGKNNLVTAQQNMLQSKYMTILDIQLLKFYNGENL